MSMFYEPTDFVSEECASLVLDTAHTLIAGTTGSGKSVLLNSIIYSLEAGDFEGKPFLYEFIDTKRVEFNRYKDYPGTLSYTTEPEDAPRALDDVIHTMERRYERMGGRESTEPHIFVVIDELADLLSTKGVLGRIVKIGRLGRAAHIHLLCCTQDPSRRTLSAQLMQNFTTCIALRCKTPIESRQIIGEDGAECLPRHGKAIVSDSYGSRIINIPLTPDYAIDDLIDYEIEQEQEYEDRLDRARRALACAKYNKLRTPLWAAFVLTPSRGKTVCRYS